MKLTKVVKSLITEIAAVDTIIDAIKKGQVIVIYYDGDEPGGRGLRTVYPVCFGYSKANNPVLRAYDLEGASHTGYKGEQPLPSWRLFRVDKILSFRPTDELFTSNEIPSNYNPNGDKSMNRVILNWNPNTTPQNLA